MFSYNMRQVVSAVRLIHLLYYAKHKRRCAVSVAEWKQNVLLVLFRGLFGMCRR